LEELFGELTLATQCSQPSGKSLGLPSVSAQSWILKNTKGKMGVKSI
jgi:hypothetical protein